MFTITGQGFWNHGLILQINQTDLESVMNVMDDQTIFNLHSRKWCHVCQIIIYLLLNRLITTVLPFFKTSF